MQELVLNEVAVQNLIMVGRWLAALSVVLTAVLYFTQKKSVYLTVLYFWLGFLFTASLGRVPVELDLQMLFFFGLGQFFTLSFLGVFCSNLHDRPLDLKGDLLFWLVMFNLSAALAWVGCGSRVYAMPVQIATVLPLCRTLFMTSRLTSKPHSVVHWVFVTFALLLSTRILLWTWIRVYPQVYFLYYGFLMAPQLLMSLLLPLIAFEDEHRRRQGQLEEEVIQKVNLLRKAEQQLWDSNKLASLGRMVGDVAHEINNPLQVIAMISEGLRFRVEKGTCADQEILKASDSLQAMVDRIARLTRSLRTVVRDSRTLDTNAADLCKIITECQTLWGKNIRFQRIDFKIEMPNHQVMVVCNSVEVSQVLLNLVGNAIDAVKDLAQKEITLRVKEKIGLVAIEVEDSGQIDPQIVSRIMDPFFTTKPVGEGTGLGLSISKSIAESHKGTLTLKSESPRTCFVIEIPKARGTPLQVFIPSVGAGAGATGTGAPGVEF